MLSPSQFVCVLCLCVQREGLNEREDLAFDFRKQRFVLSEEKHTFEKLGYPTKVSQIVLLCLASMESFFINQAGPDPPVGVKGPSMVV